MQTIKGFLDKIKTFLEEKMQERKYTLPQPPKEGQQGKELEEVQPKVILGNFPHGNFSAYTMNSRYLTAPYIALGIEEASFDYEDETIQILIQVCCYTVEAYADAKDEDMNGLRIPDNMGTLDVLNMLENIKEWIVKEAPFPVDRPIRIGSYDTKEVTYPYSFGYLSFDIHTNEGKTKNRNKSLANY